MYYGFQMTLFGGNQRKSFGQIKTHLMAKYSYGAGAGAIILGNPLFQGVSNQLQILFHRGEVSLLALISKDMVIHSCNF
jgi:hypothetical protein